MPENRYQEIDCFKKIEESIIRDWHERRLDSKDFFRNKGGFYN